MTGRHRPTPRSNDDPAGGRPSSASRPRPRFRRRTVLAVAATLAIIATAVVAVTWPSTARNVDAHASPGCVAEENLVVLAAPVIAPAVSAIAKQWQRTNPSIHDICVHVSVTAVDAREAEQSLTTATTATVWIPDSSVWTSRLITDAPSLAGQVTAARAVARSPLVVAVSPTRANTIGAAAKRGWVGALTGSAPVLIPSPPTTSEGTLALLSLQSQLGATPTAKSTLGGVFLQLGSRVIPNIAAGFAALTDYPSTAPGFVTSEQQVIAANKGKVSPAAAAVYPAGASPSLDFPLVTFNPSRVLVYNSAVQLFAQQLASPASAALFNAAGLRDAAATPLRAGSAASTVGDMPLTLASVPNAPVVTAVLREWVAAGAPRQILGVIDVSGSMKEDSGNGQSKIQVAAAAVTTAVTLMPDAWSAGLWTFSLRPAPANDWTELVHLGPVQANRAALLSAARSMPNQVGGNTGLYSTALSAFLSVTSRYAKGKFNSVLLLTDGANVDPDDITLPTLIAKLKTLADPRRPVSFTTIALGKNADVAALRKISAATHGHSYIVRQAQDINTVFAQIALQGP